MEASRPSIVCFGTFEVDLEAGELRRNGIRVKIQGQPFQVLASLLARPGQVIDREELRRKIWADNTFVDFDRRINKAVNRLRDALGDCPEAPRYIQTLARRLRCLERQQSSPRRSAVRGSSRLRLGARG